MHSLIDMRRVGIRSCVHFFQLLNSWKPCPRSRIYWIFIGISL